MLVVKWQQCEYCLFFYFPQYVVQTDAGTNNRYFAAAKLNEGLAKHEDALRCAERGLEIEEDCLGKDHPLYQESWKLVQKLKCIS